MYGAYLHATLPFQRKGRVRKIGFSDEFPNKLFELEEIKSNVDSSYYDNKSFYDLNIRIIAMIFNHIVYTLFKYFFALKI